MTNPVALSIFAFAPRMGIDVSQTAARMHIHAHLLATTTYCFALLALPHDVNHAAEAVGAAILPHSYSSSLVVLSIVIAIFASEGRLRFLWIVTGAFAMGLGFWSMHYVGMVALALPVRVLSRLPDRPSLAIRSRSCIRRNASLCQSFRASPVACFRVESRDGHRHFRDALHRHGRDAPAGNLHLQPHRRHHLDSCCHHRFRGRSPARFRLCNTNREFSAPKIASAIVMGFAIAAMHYTGMAAVSFVPAPLTDDISHSIEVTSLGAFGITIVASVVLSVVTITSVLDRKFSAQAAQLVNGVIGMADLLLDTTLNSEQREFALTLRHSANSLLAIINNTLGLSKIEAGKMTIDSIPFALDAVIYEVAELLHAKTLEKELDFAVRYAPSLASRFIADPGRIRQILTNLIGNAIKFTPRRGIQLSVEPDLSCSTEI